MLMTLITFSVFFSSLLIQLIRRPINFSGTGSPGVIGTRGPSESRVHIFGVCGISAGSAGHTDSASSGTGIMCIPLVRATDGVSVNVS